MKFDIQIIPDEIFELSQLICKSKADSGILPNGDNCLKTDYHFNKNLIDNILYNKNLVNCDLIDKKKHHNLIKTNKESFKLLKIYHN